MSFSSAVKNELCRVEIQTDCCLLSELAAVIEISGTVKFDGNGMVSVVISTENAAFARRLFSIIKKLYKVYPGITIRKSRRLKKHVSYTLVLTLPAASADFLEETAKNRQKPALKHGCCRKAYLRGAFLAGGSVSDPEKTYHLEITCHNKGSATELKHLMSRYNLNAKVIRRKGSFIVYIKEGEGIVDFLNIIGAHSALLELENVRILKEMRNNVNRIVNCETANLGKTVNASIRQIENISYIKDHIGFENLPESLREIAGARLEHTDANLKELGDMLNPPLGKSGVNHRLRKLDEIAENARCREIHSPMKEKTDI